MSDPYDQQCLFYSILFFASAKADARPQVPREDFNPHEQMWGTDGSGVVEIRRSRGRISILTKDFFS